MSAEARGQGVQFVGPYVALGFLIAISFTFPLFLIAREARLASGDARAAAAPQAAST